MASIKKTKTPITAETQYYYYYTTRIPKPPNKSFNYTITQLFSFYIHIYSCWCVPVWCVHTILRHDLSKSTNRVCIKRTKTKITPQKQQEQRRPLLFWGCVCVWQWTTVIKDAKRSTTVLRRQEEFSIWVLLELVSIWQDRNNIPLSPPTHLHRPIHSITSFTHTSSHTHYTQKPENNLLTLLFPYVESKTNPHHSISDFSMNNRDGNYFFFCI